MQNSVSFELLDSKSREELLEIANAAGIPIPPRTRKPGIINAILELDEADDSAEEVDIEELDSEGADDEGLGSEELGNGGVNTAAAEAESVAAEAETAEAAESGMPVAEMSEAEEGSRKRTVTLPANTGPASTGPANTGPSSNGPSSNGPASNGSASDDDANGDMAEEGNRRSRRGRGRERDDQFQGEAIACDGLLDLREEGYGFLRISGLLPSPDDVYVAARHVRQYELRRGDRITGASRPAARSEKNPALLRLDTINGEEPNLEQPRPLFESIAAIYPTTALPLATSQNGQLSKSDKQLLSQLDSVAAAGFGQRGLLVSAEQADTTKLVELLSTAIGVGHPDIHLMVLLIDERPEQITELARRLETSGEVVATPFDRPAEEHVAVSELTLERAKRKAEQGQDVVVVFDGLTRLARAHRRVINHRHSQPTSEPAAIASAKSLFGTARNLEQAGSVTVFATAQAASHSPMQEATLGSALVSSALAGGVSEFDRAALGEFRSAANLTWTLKAAEPNLDASLAIDEAGCVSTSHHL